MIDEIRGWDEGIYHNGGWLNDSYITCSQEILDWNHSRSSPTTKEWSRTDYTKIHPDLKLDDLCFLNIHTRFWRVRFRTTRMMNLALCRWLIVKTKLFPLWFTHDKQHIGNMSSRFSWKFVKFRISRKSWTDMLTPKYCVNVRNVS